MNETSPPPRAVARSYWSRGTVALFAFPLLILLLFLLGLVVDYRRTRGRVESKLARIREQGYPVDDLSMERWYLRQTSQDGTREWHDILRLVNAEAGTAARLPYLGSGEIPKTFTPGAVWPDNEEYLAADVTHYLQQMRPVIEKIQATPRETPPVWQPIDFQGFGTLLTQLQESRQVARLLQLEFAEAVHQGDAERALQALDSVRTVADVFDWRFCMVCDLVQMAFRDIHYSTIRMSLASDIWDEGQLQTLAEQVGPPRDLAQRWRDVLAGERAMVLASLERPERLWDQQLKRLPPWLLTTPWAREFALESYDEAMSVADAGADGLLRRAATFDKKQPDTSNQLAGLLAAPQAIAQGLLPAVSTYATSVLRNETSRRLTHAALAVKRFELAQDRWPSDLKELGETVGLEQQELRSMDGQRFQYEVGEEAAYLWSEELSRAWAAVNVEERPDFRVMIR